jgi:hypothetical protein
MAPVKKKRPHGQLCVNTTLANGRVVTAWVNRNFVQTKLYLCYREWDVADYVSWNGKRITHGSPQFTEDDITRIERELRRAK